MNLPPLHRALILTAWVAAVFCLLVAGIMTHAHFAGTVNDPWKSPQLLTLKERLASEPKNEALQGEIRQLDLNFRQKFRRRLGMDKTGAWLLMGGVLVLVLAARRAAELNRTLPAPQVRTDAAERSARLASHSRWSLVGVGLIVAGSLLVIRLANSSALDRMKPPAKVLSEDLPTLVELETNWPRFRGWNGSGVCLQKKPVDTSVVWRSSIPLPGQSSPIIWKNRVFISGANANLREVFCYTATNGALEWQRPIENVPGSPSKLSKTSSDAGWASPTLATDGLRVYALFGNGDLAALSFDGGVLWSRYVGPLKNTYGYAASLAVWRDSVLVQLDQGDSRPAGSKLMAFQGTSGRVLFERPRPVTESWATPIVIGTAGSNQIITLASPWVISYAVASGNELWRAQLLENEVVPSPVFAGNLLFLLSPGAKLMAVKPNGVGDVTKSCLAWSSDENVPDISSPVANDRFVFTVTSAGMASCFQIRDGRKVWEKDLEFEVQSSPSIIGNDLLVLGLNGTLLTLEAGSEFHEISRTRLSDRFVASPAFAGGHVFLRGATNLYCLGPASVQLTNSR